MEKKYLITASLLDAWKYLLNNEQSDFDAFLRVLRREPSETNIYQEQGFKFEKWAEENYPETQHGEYQVKLYKDIRVNNTNYLLYGIVDCIKGGIVYDYKHTNKYDVGKFYDKAQTSMYLELVPQAAAFKYIIAIDTPNYIDSSEPYIIYTESYTRNEIPKIQNIIRNFESWLIQTNLINEYKKYWESK